MVQANSDLKAARKLALQGFHPQAIWLSQQAVEKGLKAVLLSIGLQLREEDFKRFGHGLTQIQNIIPAALQLPADTTIATRLTRLSERGLSSRYPAPAPQSGKPFVAPIDRFVSSSQDIEDANVLLKWCRDRVRRAQRGVAAMKP